MELTVITADATYTHIAISGKLDIAGVAEIENHFIEVTAGRKVSAIIDVSGVTFTGSMGLRLFLRASKSLSQEKKKLILLDPQPMVNEVLVDSGIKGVVAVEKSLEAALALAQA